MENGGKRRRLDASGAGWLRATMTFGRRCRRMTALLFHSYRSRVTEVQFQQAVTKA